MIASRIAPCLALGCILLGLFSNALPASAGHIAPVDEYRIKAAFLWNFAIFITWPQDEMRDARETFMIGVHGHDPFNGALEKTFRGKKVHGRTVSIHASESIEDLLECDLVFVADCDVSHTPAVLDAVAGKNVLLVGDAVEFLEHGAMIAFRTRNERVEFVVNLEEVRAAGFQISTKMLRLAQIVEEVRSR